MRWSYKTVYYELKKEGLLGSTFLDESEVEMSLNEYGKAGWELVSLLETMDGVIAVFKQPLSLSSEDFFVPSVSDHEESVVEQTLEVDDQEELEEPTLPDEVVFEDQGIISDDAVLLDDYEVVEEVNDSDVEESSEKKADIGSIRIE